MPDRRVFYRPLADSDRKRCGGCGEWRLVSEFGRDSSKLGRRASICRACGRAKSRRYYAEHRAAVLARIKARKARAKPAEAPTCSECGGPLPGKARVVCSSRCKDRRFKRLHPEAYAERERRKVE